MVGVARGWLLGRIWIWVVEMPDFLNGSSVEMVLVVVGWLEAFEVAASGENYGLAQGRESTHGKQMPDNMGLLETKLLFPPFLSLIQMGCTLF